MADIKNVNLDGTLYNYKDEKARNDISDLKEDITRLDTILNVPLNKDGSLTHTSGWTRSIIIDNINLKKDAAYIINYQINDTTINPYVYLTNGNTDLLTNKMTVTQGYIRYVAPSNYDNCAIKVACDSGATLTATISIEEGYNASIIDYLKDLVCNTRKIAGYIWRKEGILTDYSAEYTFATPKIPCKSGDVFKYTGRADFNYVSAIFFNNNSVISFQQTPSVNVTNATYTAPDDCNYVAFSSYGTDQFNVVPVITDDVGAYAKKTELSPLYGKKLCCDGDSIMAGAGNNGVSFADMIANKNNMTLNKIAVAGATICSGTTDGANDRHWISESIGTLDNDGDYYIFDGWVNDCNSSTNLGSVTWGYEATLDTTIFCQAFEKCCKTLATTYKGKKVGYVFVHRIWQPTDTLAQSFIDDMIQILKKWGIPYINLMEEIPSLNLISELKSAYTSNGDGWHPNEQGYQKYYVDKIEAWLKTL